MDAGDARVLSELQGTLDALEKAAEHLQRASLEDAASGVPRKLAGARGSLEDLRQEVSYLMRLVRGQG
jgi:hypothetical protein